MDNNEPGSQCGLESCATNSLSDNTVLGKLYKLSLKVSIAIKGDNACLIRIVRTKLFKLGKDFSIHKRWLLY